MTEQEAGYDDVRNPCPSREGGGPCCFEHERGTCCQCGAAPRPRLLDGCCGAGGASAGYVRAGFSVRGYDIAPQANYPYEFVQGDIIAALRWLLARPHALAEWDAFHISPPCQRYSGMTNCRPGVAEEYPDLVAEVRTLLQAIGKPYVIENVPGSPLVDPVMLCGFMFGRELYRHRLFEANFPIPQPEHPLHTMPASKAGHWRPGTVMSVAGHVAPVAKAREVMEIDWTTREELAEAIPPYYSEHVGRALMTHLRNQSSEAVA